MKFKRIGIFTAILLGTSTLALPALANVKNLNMSNQTSYPLSFSVNGVCSKLFGTMGAYSIKTISEHDFLKACRYSISPCEVVIHGQKSCQAPRIATLYYYLERNFVELHGHSVPKISIGVSGYNVFLSESFDLKKPQ